MLSYADEIGGDALKSNLVLFGGPDGNPISREVMGRISTTFRFGSPDLHEIAVRDMKEGKIYAPTRLVGSAEVSRDYESSFVCPTHLILEKMYC